MNTTTLTTSTTPNTSSNYSCKFCDKQFKTKSKFNRHVREIHVDPSKTFQCEFCDKSFKRREHYKRHVRGKHLEHKFECPLCDSCHVEKSRLKTHLQKSHDLHCCNSCGAFHSEAPSAHSCDQKMLFQPLHLIKHGIIFDCKACRVCFLSEEALAAHSCKATAVPAKPQEAALSATTAPESCDAMTVVSQSTYQPTTNTHSPCCEHEGPHSHCLLAKRAPLEPLSSFASSRSNKRLGLAGLRSNSLDEEEELVGAELFPSPFKYERGGLFEAEVPIGDISDLLSSAAVDEEDIFGMSPRDRFRASITSDFERLSPFGSDDEDHADELMECSPLNGLGSKGFNASEFLF